MTPRARRADYRDIIGQVDAAIVAVPTIAHAEIGCALLEAGIDVLIEKPIASTLAEADRLVDAATRNGRILQVGHLERFNPAVIALEKAATLPLFFEIHRMSVFTPRSLDVDVVLDLMIHDLDIVLALARAELKEIRAAGISILSPKVDIANVRLEFDDGCISNMTASRVSTEKVRKLRLFQPSNTFQSITRSRPPRFLRSGARWESRSNSCPSDRPNRCNSNSTLSSMLSKLARPRKLMAVLRVKHWS